MVEAFKDVVGRSRQEVATTLLERFDLEEAARKRLDEFDADEPWEAYVGVRLGYYEKMVRDPDVLRENRWPYSVDLLRVAGRMGCFTALATTSRREQVNRVLKALNLTKAFDAVSVREDVENTKPDPEVYLLTARKLELSPAECLVLEDSPVGVRAGLAAGMEVIALATPFTKRVLAEADLLPPDRVVDDPRRMETMVKERLGRTCLDESREGGEPDQ